MEMKPPLPNGWHLYTTVHCPYCNNPMHFSPGPRESLERDMHCPTVGCDNKGIVYHVKMALEGVTVEGSR